MKQVEFSHMVMFIGFLLGGLGMIWFTSGQTILQLGIGGLIAAGYVLWGILHHAHKGDLHLKVVIEYLLIATIAFIILVTFTV